MKSIIYFFLATFYAYLVWANYLILVPTAVLVGWGIYKAWQVRNTIRNIKRGIIDGDWVTVLASIDNVFGDDERGKEIAKILEDVAVKRHGGAHGILRDAGIFMVEEAE